MGENTIKNSCADFKTCAFPLVTELAEKDSLISELIDENAESSKRLDTIHAMDKEIVAENAELKITEHKIKGAFWNASASRKRKVARISELEAALEKISAKANAQTAQIDIKNIDKSVALQHYAVIVEFIDIAKQTLNKDKD